ncbi:MAG: 50S ribosomal protein L21 [Hydrogenobaculum sp.]|jgi:large subunit ribosomal protein L21
MYAVIETGSKQYVVKEGDVLKVEKLPFGENEEIELPALSVVKDGAVKLGGKVKAKVLSTAKDKKVLIFKHLPKKHSKKLRGHRQFYTKISILSIGE